MNTFFIYDLEFIGDVSNPRTCRIWDVAVLCVSTRETFRAVIDPDPHIMYFPPPPVPECMHLTRDFLYKHRAKIFGHVFVKLVKWVYNRTPHVPIFISHNNFRSDKIILETEAMRYNMVLPNTWRFFDSLLFIRDKLPNMREYNMSYLVKHILHTEPKNMHRAMTDTIYLYKIMRALTNNFKQISGETIAPYKTSLRTVKGIGRAVQQHFFNAGIYDLETIRSMIHTMYTQAMYSGENVDQMIQQWLRMILRDLPVRCRIDVQRSISA
jgi:DNA polymerase III alpha subunit (gram-positive type)